MKRIFVFEYLTGGGARTGDHDPAADARAAAVELAALGRTMRDAMVGDLLQGAHFSVSVAVDDGTDDLPAPALGVRRLAGESVFDFVARQSALHDLSWVVAPETGGVLARLCRSVAPRRWLGCSHAAIRLASSKRATLLRLAGRGLPTPLAFDRSQGVFRWIVKPDDGAGAIATRVHASRAAAWADADRRARVDQTASVEAFIEGEALSLSLLCDGDAAELLSINRQRISIAADGAVAFDGVDVNAIAWRSAAHGSSAGRPNGPPDPRGPVLADLARQAAQAVPGLRGFVGIDLVWHARHGPVLIEINPRVTCAYVGLSKALGRNLAAELVAQADMLAAPETADAAA